MDSFTVPKKAVVLCLRRWLNEGGRPQYDRQGMVFSPWPAHEHAVRFGGTRIRDETFKRWVVEIEMGEILERRFQGNLYHPHNETRRRFGRPAEKNLAARDREQKGRVQRLCHDRVAERPVAEGGRFRIRICEGSDQPALIDLSFILRKKRTSTQPRIGELFDTFDCVPILRRRDPLLELHGRESGR